MALKIEETIGGAPAVGLLAIGAMALALIFNQSSGTILPKSTNCSPQLAAVQLPAPHPQVLGPSIWLPARAPSPP